MNPLSVEDFKQAGIITGPPEYLKTRKKARAVYIYLKAVGKDCKIETAYGIYPDHFK